MLRAFKDQIPEDGFAQDKMKDAMTRLREAASIYKYFFEYMHDGGKGQVLFQSGKENPSAR